MNLMFIFFTDPAFNDTSNNCVKIRIYIFFSCAKWEDFPISQQISIVFLCIKLNSFT
jgi:hypothetical protein